MTRTVPLTDQLRKALGPNPGGVVGLVDDLLRVCRGNRVRLDYRDDHCHVRSLGADENDLVDVPMPRATFRAVLARVAALCNERVPGSVTPYHGDGELAITSGPPAVFRVAFTNTTLEQRLELQPLTGHADAADATGRLTTVA